MQHIEQQETFASDELSTMRLLLEGAVALYESDAMQLVRIAQHHNQTEALAAYDALGTALYTMQTLIRGSHLKQFDANMHQQDV